MPITHRYEPTTKLLTITPVGQVSMSERSDLFSSLIGDLSIPSDTLILINPSNLSPAFVHEDKERIAELLDTLRYRFAERVAVLCTNPEFFESCRIVVAATDRGTGKVKLFQDPDRADDWLFPQRTAMELSGDP